MSEIRADRLSKLPAYLFAEVDRKKREAIAAGRDVIDFGVGDPDTPTPTFIINRMAEAIRDPANHPYSFGIGMRVFRDAVVRYMDRRFGVSVDPDKEVIALLGSKEGIGHLPTAIINPGQVVLCPEPGYPVYVSGTIFAGGTPYIMPLADENNWLPVLEDIPADVLDRTKLMYLNYPNNPTAAIADREFFEKVIGFAKQHDIIVAHDAPYIDLYYGDESPVSIMQVDGAKEVAIELHSLSKTFSMTGWRMAFAVGHSEVLAALAKVKNNMDSGVFQAVQHAGIAALDGIERQELKDLVAMYKKRRDILVAGLRESGWPCNSPEATLYVWARCPEGSDSTTVATRLLEEADVVVTPGAGLGETSKGFVRFSLTVPEDRIREAVKRITSLSW